MSGRLSVGAIRLIVATAVSLAVPLTYSQAAVLGLACGFEGKDHDLCKDAAEQWAARTGHTVLTYPVPDDPAERLALFGTVLSQDGPKFDVIEMDVTWAAALATDLLSLESHLSDAFAGQSELMVHQLTIDGHLKGMPFHGQLAGLYYRDDLLKKYDLDVPETWEELRAAARTIQDGERAAGNADFWGYIFQGGMGESLTANAVEWLVSHRGAAMLNADGSVTFDNPDYVEALENAAGWIGTISPPDVLSFDEEDTRAMFQIGNAAFMRNLPYVYTLLNSPISPVVGNVGAAFMPAAHGNPPAAMLDGWALVIAERTSDPVAAASLVRHLTSTAEQRRRALEANFYPSRVLLFSDREVRSNFPIVEDFEAVEGNIRMRPPSLIGKGYAEGSVAFQRAVQTVLRGERDAAGALRDAQVEITEILTNARNP